MIGGAAGAVPVLVGWAAVRNDLAAPAWILFAVVFFWTPAHFWALALKYRDDYAAAGIPMLPVVRGIEATTRQIVGYAMVRWRSRSRSPLTGDVGRFYAVSVLVLGAVFVVQALALHARRRRRKRAIRFFAWSNVYLMLVFVAVAVDTLLRRSTRTEAVAPGADRARRPVDRAPARPARTIVVVTRDSDGTTRSSDCDGRRRRPRRSARGARRPPRSRRPIAVRSATSRPTSSCSTLNECTRCAAVGLPRHARGADVLRIVVPPVRAGDARCSKRPARRARRRSTCSR